MKLIATLPDIAPLKLEMPATRQIIGESHWMKTSASPNPFLLVCNPTDFTAAENFLSGLGATVLPWQHDPATQVGSTKAAAFANVPAAADTGWTAAQKLFARYEWPPLDPLGPFFRNSH